MKTQNLIIGIVVFFVIIISLLYALGTVINWAQLMTFLFICSIIGIVLYFLLLRNRNRDSEFAKAMKFVRDWAYEYDDKTEFMNRGFRGITGYFGIPGIKHFGFWYPRKDEVGLVSVFVVRKLANGFDIVKFANIHDPKEYINPFAYFDMLEPASPTENSVVKESLIAKQGNKGININTNLNSGLVETDEEKKK